MQKYIAEEKANEEASRAMKDKIESRKKELASKKISDEENQMRKYMEEEKAIESSQLDLLKKITSTRSSSLAPSPSSSNSGDQLKTSIVSSQQFDGCWDADAIKGLLKEKFSEVLAANPNCHEKLWCTAIAIALLELKCKELKSTWDIVANKGKTFMSKFLLQEKMERDKILPYVTSLIQQAEEVLRKFL